MKRLVLVLAVVVMGGSAFAQGKAAPAPKANKDEDAVKALVSDFAAAWNKHDPKAMAAICADDATVINPWGRVAKGKVEIEKLFTDEQVGPPGMLKDTTWTATIQMWRPLGANFAFVDIDAEIGGLKSPDGKPMPGKHHLGLVVAKKANKWSFLDARPYFFAPPAPPPKAATPAPAPAPAKK